jgi:hypothetical protein
MRRILCVDLKLWHEKPISAVALSTEKPGAHIVNEISTLSLGQKSVRQPGDNPLESPCSLTLNLPSAEEAQTVLSHPM